jgi:hypothetical protein
MKKSISALLISVLILTSCTTSIPESHTNKTTQAPQTAESPPIDIDPEIDIAEIITEFLSDYPTLFMTMQVYGEFEETPDIYFREYWNDLEQHLAYYDAGYYDRDGNRIESAPWLSKGSTEYRTMNYEYAAAFTLWDFDQNGIPTIIIWFRPNPNNASCYMGYWQTFRFIDGEYRLVSSTCDRNLYHFDGALSVSGYWQVNRSGWADYYFDDSENLVVRLPTDRLSGPGGSYSRIEFDGNEATFTAIAVYNETAWNDNDEHRDFDFDYVLWDNLLTEETVACYISSDFLYPEAHLLPGSDDVTLTPIEPMTELQELITRRFT